MMKTIKVLMSVATQYIGSTVEEVIDIQVDDDATTEEIKEAIEEILPEWVNRNIDSGWMIIES